MTASPSDCEAQRFPALFARPSRLGADDLGASGSLLSAQRDSFVRRALTFATVALVSVVLTGCSEPPLDPPANPTKAMEIRKGLLEDGEEKEEKEGKDAATVRAERDQIASAPNHGAATGGVDSFS